MNEKRKKQFSVAASPLNMVKLDLALVFLIAIILFIVLEYSASSALTPLVVMALYSVFSTVWIIWRINRITRNVLAQTKADGLASDKES